MHSSPLTRTYDQLSSLLRRVGPTVSCMCKIKQTLLLDTKVHRLGCKSNRAAFQLLDCVMQAASNCAVTKKMRFHHRATVLQSEEERSLTAERHDRALSVRYTLSLSLSSPFLVRVWVQSPHPSPTPSYRVFARLVDTQELLAWRVLCGLSQHIHPLVYVVRGSNERKTQQLALREYIDGWNPGGYEV